MERWQRKSLELISSLALLQKEDPSVIPYRPQKLTVSRYEMPSLRRCSPERQGVSSHRLLLMLRDLENHDEVNIHNLMILRHGEVILECSSPGYDTRLWHLAHSMTKTVIGMAIGMLVDDGLLDTSTALYTLFPELTYRYRQFGLITIEHLLTMTTGIRFAEVGVATEDAWSEAFFSSGFHFKPGEDFAYNSMNSYMLAKVVERVTGKRVCDFLDERLFAPLGITNRLWELGPEGIEKGGWGLFLSPESWAKLGLMMLGGGEYQGQRILSSEWVARSLMTHAITPERAGDFNYGYQLWVNRENDEFLFNGMLGQNVWVCPTEDVVVVINAGNNELFQQSAALGIVRRYLSDLPERVHRHRDDLRKLRAAASQFAVAKHWIRPKKRRTGLGVILGIQSAEPYIPAWNILLGTYRFRRNNYGMLPLFIRVMQNNYQGGIESLTFRESGDRLYLTSREGGVDYTVQIGLYGYAETVLSFCGEKYIVKAMGVAIRDEDQNPVFKIELQFPEMPNTRTIKLSFLPHGELLVRMSEYPNHKIAESFIDSMPVNSPKLEFISQMLDRKMGEKYIVRKLYELFSPVLVGAEIGTENYRAILEDEEQKQEEEVRSARFISGLISRYAEDEGEVGNERGAIRSLLSRFGLFKDKRGEDSNGEA